MKKIVILISVISFSLAGVNSAKFIKIEKNVSKSFALKIMKKAKASGIKFILNPKVNCLNIGFSKEDIFAQGIMMGRDRADGSLEVSGVGDFKAYSYIRYKRGERECIDTIYTKEYDPSRFGKFSYMVYR